MLVYFQMTDLNKKFTLQKNIESLNTSKNSSKTATKILKVIFWEYALN